MKLTALTAAISVVITVTLNTLPVLASPKLDMASLNNQLQQALCSEDWGRSIEIVEQMHSMTPPSQQEMRSKLKTLQTSLQNLSISRTNVSNWLNSYCATPANTPVAANDSSYSGSNNDSSTSLCSQLSSSGLKKAACDLAKLMLGEKEFRSAMTGAVSASSQEVARLGSSCQQSVPFYLKSPASTSFPETPWVTETVTGIYVVGGKVDAQNSYGALIRGNYTCIYRNDSKKGMDYLITDVSS